MPLGKNSHHHLRSVPNKALRDSYKLLTIPRCFKKKKKITHDKEEQMAILQLESLGLSGKCGHGF